MVLREQLANEPGLERPVRSRRDIRRDKACLGGRAFRRSRVGVRQDRRDRRPREDSLDRQGRRLEPKASWPAFCSRMSGLGRNRWPASCASTGRSLSRAPATMAAGPASPPNAVIPTRRIWCASSESFQALRRGVFSASGSPGNISSIVWSGSLRKRALRTPAHAKEFSNVRNRNHRSAAHLPDLPLPQRRENDRLAVSRRSGSRCMRDTNTTASSTHANSAFGSSMIMLGDAKSDVYGADGRDVRRARRQIHLHRRRRHRRRFSPAPRPPEQRSRRSRSTATMAAASSSAATRKAMSGVSAPIGRRRATRADGRF